MNFELSTGMSSTPLFSFASKGIEVLDGGLTVRSIETFKGRSCAVCNKGFSSGIC